MAKKINLSEFRSLIKEEVLKLNKRAILESEKKNLLKELSILNENYDENPDTALKQFLIDSIDLSGYDLKNVGGDEQLLEFYNIFVEEKGWDIKISGVKKALEDYLRGMPSSTDLPTYYGEVINLLYSIGFNEVKNMEDEEVDKFYYTKLVEIILNSVKINKKNYI